MTVVLYRYSIWITKMILLSYKNIQKWWAKQTKYDWETSDSPIALCRLFFFHLILFNINLQMNCTIRHWKPFCVCLSVFRCSLPYLSRGIQHPIYNILQKYLFVKSDNVTHRRERCRHSCLDIQNILLQKLHLITFERVMW